MSSLNWIVVYEAELIDGRYWEETYYIHNQEEGEIKNSENSEHSLIIDSWHETEEEAYARWTDLEESRRADDY